MNEQMIYQNMSQLVFNAMMRGVDRETATKGAEETIRLLIQRSKVLAAEANPDVITTTGA